MTFILQHAGMLEDLSEIGRSQWRSGMDKLAARPNVHCKLSGLGSFLHRNDAAHIADIVRFAMALFGPDRCLFGSNFPIEKLWTGYTELVQSFDDAVAGFGPQAAAAVFWDTAAKVYRLAT
jgi:predicted TIM-barrel fold metal-dependent hydrolase